MLFNVTEEGETAVNAAYLLKLIQQLSPTHRRHILRFSSAKGYRSFMKGCYNLSRGNQLQLRRYFRLIPSIKGAVIAVSSLELLDTFSSDIIIERDQRIKLPIQLPRKLPIEKESSIIPWGVKHIGAPEIWPYASGNKIRIAVIDTGVDYFHPDLQHNLLRGHNVLQPWLPPQDDNGHGTHIAGTIAACGDKQGLLGVAPHAAIQPVKAFDQLGAAYISDIITAIEWCIRQNVDLINMSFGMQQGSAALREAVVRASEAGILIIASSGNDGQWHPIDYPARWPETISVGAVNRRQKICPFSNRGEYVDLYAPGDRILSSWLNGRYRELNGTSMATAHVCGLAALMLSLQPSTTIGSLREWLTISATAPPTGTYPRCVNGQRALRYGLHRIRRPYSNQPQSIRQNRTNRRQ